MSQLDRMTHDVRRFLRREEDMDVPDETVRAVLRSTISFDTSSIEALSGVSAFDGHPYCTLRWGDNTGQLTPAELRTHALWLLECAEAAESDALVYAELTENVGLDSDTALGVIVALRNRRSPA